MAVAQSNGQSRAKATGVLTQGVDHGKANRFPGEGNVVLVEGWRPPYNRLGRVAAYGELCRVR